MKRAIVYHASCLEHYAKAAVLSAKTAKKNMPDVDTVFITSLSGDFGQFDRVIRIDDPGYVNAHFPQLMHVPREYDSAIYLDCITLVIAPLYDVFELVEDSRTDMALTFTSGKKHDSFYPSNLPTLFPHWRSALIAFQNHDRMRKFWGDWWNVFETHRDENEALRQEGTCHPDQPTLRLALYHSDLSVVTLRTRFCCPAGGVVIRGTVRVLTGNGDMERRARIVNRQAPKRRLFHDGKVTAI